MEDFDKLQAGYVALVELMIERARTWYSQHPDAGAVVSRQWPRTIFVAATLQSAIAMGLVAHNDAGKQLLDYMTAEIPLERAPSVGQVRAALELARGDA